MNQEKREGESTAPFLAVFLFLEMISLTYFEKSILDKPHTCVSWDRSLIGFLGSKTSSEWT
jgi:hypothetical protein